MTAHLEDRVAAYVADHADLTADQIALALRARRASVVGVLKFSGLFDASEGPRASRTYRLASDALGRAGTRKRTLTHKERVLRLLADGRPHSHMEGYRLNVMLHSRVADLRRDGYRIDCYREGDLYYYRLVGGLLGAGSGEAESPLPAPSGLTGHELEPGLSPTAAGRSKADSGSAASGAEAIGRELNGQLTFATPEFRKQVAA